MTVDEVYQGLIRRVLEDGDEVTTRNSRVKRLFAEKVVFSQTPVVSVRKTAWKTALREMEWILSGSDNINDLHPSAHPWWKPWADPRGTIRYNYGQQLRRFARDDGYGGYEHGHDQVGAFILGIKDHPYSRRHVMTTWNPYEMSPPDCPITNCHGSLTQAFVTPGYPEDTLHLVTYQRSVDVVCGLTANWAQYWALLLWLSHRAGKVAGTLTWVGGDVHVYGAHNELAKKIVGAVPPRHRPVMAYYPSTEEFKADDFHLEGYDPVLTDKAEMIV